MTCCLLVGNKAVDWNFRKKLFVVSLLAHLILMNMFRLNALIFQNWRLLVFGVNIRASQSLLKELQSVRLFNFNWNTRKLVPPFFPPLTVKSYLKFFFFIGATIWLYCIRTSEMRKGQNCPSPLCLLHMLYFKRKWYSLKFIAKWHVVYWLGLKAVDWNIRKKLFLVSL